MFCNKWASLPEQAKICRAWRMVRTRVSPFPATRTWPEGASKGWNQCSTSDTHPICFAIHSRPVCQDLVNQSSEREESGFHCFHAVFFLSFTPPFITAIPPSCFLLLNTVLKPLCNPQLIFQARLRALPLGCRKISWQTGWQYIKLVSPIPNIHFCPHRSFTCSSTTADENTGWTVFPKQMRINKNNNEGEKGGGKADSIFNLDLILCRKWSHTAVQECNQGAWRKQKRDKII